MPEPTSPPLLLPVVVEEIDVVRVEKSLHSLGFFASAANREMSRSVEQVFRRPDGQRIQAKAVIEGIPSLGLPTTADRDKYMAFMKIALDQREFQGELANPVRFSGADMIKLLRLRKGGFHYDEINDWCKRMVATTIMSEASIYMADRRQYVTDTFHVFDRVVLLGEELKDGTRAEFYQVYLSQWQLTNLNHGYLLPLDFNAYLKLKRDIAKALFGHLSVWFYASRGQPIEKRYSNLCQLLNIRAYPHLSKALSVLEPSLKELSAIGYLSEWELTRNSKGSEFKLILSPGKRLLSLPSFAGLASPETTLPQWVAKLVERGVVERKARQLALDIPDEQPVLDQIEYADYLIEQDRRGRGKISNPAGLYVWAIENDLCVPLDFETSAKKRLREEQLQADREQRSTNLEFQNAYHEYCHEQIRKRLESEYQGEQLENALRDQMKLIRREQPDWYARIPDTTRREVALSRLKSGIRERLELPAFEEWAKKQTQRSLF